MTFPNPRRTGEVRPPSCLIVVASSNNISMPLFPSLFVSSFPLPHPQSRRDNLGFFGEEREEIGGSSNSPLSRCHRRTRTRLPDPRRSGCHCFVWPQYPPCLFACLSASLIWCRVKLAWGKEGGRAPCHVIAIARCHLSSAPLFLLATPIFRDTIFSSQSPPSPPPLSSSSFRSYAVSPPKLLFILAPTKSFVFVSSFNAYLLLSEPERIILQFCFTINLGRAAQEAFSHSTLYPRSSRLARPF